MMPSEINGQSAEVTIDEKKDGSAGLVPGKKGPDEKKEGDIWWSGNSLHFGRKYSIIIPSLVFSIFLIVFSIAAIIAGGISWLDALLILPFVLLFSINYVVWQTGRRTPTRVGISDKGVHLEFEEGVKVDDALRFSGWADIVGIERERGTQGARTLVMKDGRRISLDFLDEENQQNIVSRRQRMFKGR
jgi:hypothetical protein